MALAEAPQPESVIPEWSLGDRLVKARKHAGLKQSEMATALSQKLGREVSGPAVSTWERGEHAPADLLETVRAWADLTGVDFGWLVGVGSRTGSFSPLVGLPATLTPELPFPPSARQLAVVGS